MLQYPRYKQVTSKNKHRTQQYVIKLAPENKAVVQYQRFEHKEVVEVSSVNVESL